MKPENKKRGIALLITLVILLLLTISLSKVFEDGSMEIRMLEHDELVFEADTLTTSLFKALLKAIKQEGANHIYEQLSQIPSGVPMAIDEEIPVQIVNPAIWSMDHYFNINSRIDKSDAAGINNLQIAENIVQQELKSSFPDDFLIKSLLGGINDLIDQDDIPVTENFLVGAEEGSYNHLKPSFSVKNAELDFISEIGLFPAYKQIFKKRSASVVETINFRPRALPVKAYEGRSQCAMLFNLNMLPKGDKSGIENALRKYADFFNEVSEETVLCGYEVLVNQIDEFIPAVLEKRNSMLSEPFMVPLRNSNKWKDITENLGLDGAKITNLFESRSWFVGVRFELDGGNKRLRRVTAHLELDYPSSNTDIPKKISVIYYKVE